MIFSEKRCTLFGIMLYLYLCIRLVTAASKSCVH